MGLMARYMEGLLGLEPFITYPANIVVSGMLFASGANGRFLSKTRVRKS